MDDLAKLQYLSLVSKVCAELDAHLGVSDKTLAEFIIDLAQKHPELGAFRAALDENGAEFPASFASNLLALVAKMMPKKRTSASQGARASSSGAGAGPQERFAGLAVANDSDERRRQLELDALGPGGAVADPADGVGKDWKCPQCSANVFASKDRCALGLGLGLRPPTPTPHPNPNPKPTPNPNSHSKVLQVRREPGQPRRRRRRRWRRRRRRWSEQHGPSARPEARGGPEPEPEP